MNRTLLKDFGFTEYESLLYLTLLSQGPLSAYTLAEKAGLYRQVTYDTLYRLVEKGLVSSVQEGKSQIFKALDPALLLATLQEKAEQFKQFLPTLKKLEKQSQDSLLVETYKGSQVTRIALRDIITCLQEKGGEVLCTAVDEFIPLKKYQTLCEQYERDMLTYHITERVILMQGSKGIFTKGTSTYRTIPKKYFNDNPVQIYGNNIQLLIWGNPDYLLIIRSKEAAEAYRKQFEFLWKFAKK